VAKANAHREVSRLPTLSIVIVTWNSEGVLASCLDALARHPCSEGQEVIVVDNRSADSSADIAQSRPGVTLLQTGRNLGYGRALNLGARHARGEFLLFLNPDVRVGPGSIDAMVNAARASDYVGVVGCEQRASDGSFRAAGFFGYPSPVSVVREVLRYPNRLHTALLSEKRPVCHYVGDGSVRIAAVDWVLGSVLLLRKAVFDTVGGFDEFIFLYLEEIDLCFRIKTKLFKRVMYVPGNPVFHDGGAEAGPWNGSRKISYFLSCFHFVKKHQGMVGYVAVRAGFFAAVCWSSIYEGAKRAVRHSDFPVVAAWRIALMRLTPMYGD
jgi:N-acetylglucosaminyl-diphospho-decaprenol L-rhamnosyltransferase